MFKQVLVKKLVLHVNLKPTLQVWSWVQQGSSVLSNCSEAGRQLSEAEDVLKTHLQLQTQAEVHTATHTRIY